MNPDSIKETMTNDERRMLQTLERRMNHLRRRIAERSQHQVSYDRSELSALKWATKQIRKLKRVEAKESGLEANPGMAVEQFVQAMQDAWGIKTDPDITLQLGSVYASPEDGKCFASILHVAVDGVVKRVDSFGVDRNTFRYLVDDLERLKRFTIPHEDKPVRDQNGDIAYLRQTSSDVEKAEVHHGKPDCCRVRSQPGPVPGDKRPDAEPRAQVARSGDR